jgi:hypothetical protein
MSTPPTDKTRKSRKAKGRKAPGMLSFVVWRQFFMLLAAPFAAAALMPVFSMENSWIAMLIAIALPAFVHGQLWKWSYDWSNRGAAVVRNLRIGQIVAGVVHIGLISWALVLLATGEVVMGEGNGQTSGFFVGLAIAGLAAGVWETVRPVMELRDPPEVKEAAARKAARAAAKAKAKAEAEARGEAEPAQTDVDAEEDPATVE